MRNGYRLAPAVIDSLLDCGALFVIIPGPDQQKRHGMLGGVLPPQVESVGKGLAAARRDVPVKSPGCFAVIETRPRRLRRRSYQGISTAWCCRSSFRYCSPQLLPLPPLDRVDPCVVAVDGCRELAGGIFIDEQGRLMPTC